MSSEAPTPEPIDLAKVPGPDGLTPNEREAASIASLYIEGHRAALSDARYPCMFVWSQQELSGAQARDTVQADKPYRWLGGWPVPRAMLIQVPMRPEWANFGWLCVVEIVANPLSWAGNRPAEPDTSPRGTL